MVYNLYPEDFDEMTSVNFSEQTGKNLRDTLHKRKLTASFGKCEWYSRAEPQIMFTRVKCEINKNIRISGEIQASGLCLCFMLKGCSFYKYPHLKQQEIDENKNNVFYLQNTTAVYNMFKNQSYDSFEIFLTLGFIEKLMSWYPEEMECLSKKMKHDSVTAQGEKHFDTTIPMKQIIRQIEQASLMGNCSSMYLEAKTQELLAMQLQPYHSPLKMVCINHLLKHKNKIEEARYLLEKQYLNPPSIHTLAQQAGTNKTTLKEGFKHFYNNTVYGYLLEYRMNIACQLLLDSNESLVDIAEKAGYEHQSHFSTAFKRRFGVSPLIFRKKGYFPLI